MTETSHTSTEAPAPARPPGAPDVPSMRGTLARHAVPEDADHVGLVTSPKAGNDTGPDRVTRDSEAFRLLAEDLPVRRVQYALVMGMTWPWLLESVTTPAARNRAVRRGLVARPVGLPDALLMPYQLTDAGRADLLDWVTRITPHRHLPEVDALWRVVTWM